jgi:hypothetical protein
MTPVLLRPLSYLSVKHGSKTLVFFNWGLPFLISAAAACVLSLVAPTANLFHEDGLADRFLGFVQSLPGFYIAALSAVATFGRADLDELMPGVPPTSKIIYNGEEVEVPLTRRRFLCLMFSYLTVISIAITIACIFALCFVDDVRSAVGANAVEPLRVISGFTILLASTQMIVITLWGLYYLGERMHTPDK